jgi:hypothetical protein
MTTDPSSTPDTPAPEQDADEAPDTKAQFRAALERKRRRQQGGANAAPGDPKVPGAHGAAGNHRMFRRKSG